MVKTLPTGLAACAALVVTPVAQADRAEPPPLYGRRARVRASTGFR